MEDKLLTRKEAAVLIGIGLTSFSKIQNEIPSVKVKRSIRFYKSDVENYIKTKGGKNE